MERCTWCNHRFVDPDEHRKQSPLCAASGMRRTMRLRRLTCFAWCACSTGGFKRVAGNPRAAELRLKALERMQ